MEETFKGGDGKTCDTAVIIVAKGEYQGLVAEHYWLSINYPEYEITGQALAGYNNKPHDIITIQKTGSEPINVCFDISSFFGSM